MTEKDPEDMTASELLRWAANGEPNEYGNTTVIHKLLVALSGKRYSSTTNDDDARNIRDFANQIDEEIEMARMDARNVSFWTGLDARIVLLDYPLRKNETLDTWLQRCFIQRPLDEYGEPVQFGDDAGDDAGDEVRGIEKLIFLRPGCCQIQDADGHMCNVFPGERVKRPAPEVLGADGKPIVAGETVYPISGDWIGDPLEVESIDRDGSVRVSLSEGKGWTCYLADRLTHTPPDTQERIDEAARKYFDEYWGCTGAVCDQRPAKIDGEKPKDRFGTNYCSQAIVFDLLRRQRELDKRTGGAE